MENLVEHTKKKNIQQKLTGLNSGWVWGGIAALICAILGLLMLWNSPVLGVADDGTLAPVLQGAGLAYPSGTSASADYFQRFYVWNTELKTGVHSLQTGVIWLAKMLSQFVNGKGFFDIRFLGLIYLLLFLPALAMLVKAASDRVTTLSQKLVAALLAVVMFADVGYMTYFNSFYPEPLIFIGLLYLAGAAMNLQRKSRFEFCWLFLFVIAGSLLCFVRRYCLLAGLMGAVFCLAQLYRHPQFEKKVAIVLMAFVMMCASFGSLFFMAPDFHETDHLHAMSRGVLMSAKNPEKTLSEFGIDPSYSLLTDASAYDLFPLTNGSDPILSKGFLEQYTSWDIAAYYVRHPAQFVPLIEASVKTNLAVRRESCGNYEKASGEMPKAKSTFWATYSTLKNRFAPKTFGYFAILVLVAVAISANGFSLRKEQNRQNSIYLECVVTLALLAVLQTGFVIVKSGTPMLLTYNAQLGMIMDLLLYFIIIEVIGRLNKNG